MFARPTAARQVQRLRLRAPDETIARRGVRLLEDALRTANLPDAGARIVVFRRLALGRFSSGISPQALSLALERRVAALRAHAVHAADPHAAQSAAVWFRDTLEAHTLIALRVADGAPALWFWPLIVPGIEDAGAVPDRMRLILRSLRRYPEAPTAVRMLVRVLTERGHARLLRAVMDAETAAMLVAGATLRRVVTQKENRKDNGEENRNEKETVALPPKDPHSHVQRTANAAAGAAASSASPVVVQACDRAVPSAVASLPPAARNGERGGHSQEASTEATSHPRANPNFDSVVEAVAQFDTEAPECVLLNPAAGKVTALRDMMAAQALAHPRDLGVRQTSTAPSGRRSIVRASPFERKSEHENPGDAFVTADGNRPLEQLPWPDGEPTEAGGLMFLLPVLARLGYAEWLDETPDWAPLRIDKQVLALVCRRLDLPAQDPAWRLCRTTALTAPARYRAPDIWMEGIADCRRAWRRQYGADGTRIDDASGRLLLAAWPGRRRPAAFASLLRGRNIARQRASLERNDLVDAVAAAWLTACRRWLRRSGGIGVASLVMRPARFSLTPTHADMFFELSAVSLIARRAGLDLDPGWLPWFGRVVGFHYGCLP